MQVLRLLVNEPNVMLLDEPTNDLDVETLTEVEDLLDGWPGSLVVVSHDRYFLEQVNRSVLIAMLGDGKLSYLGGGIEEYLVRRAAQEAAASGPRPGPQAGSGLGAAGAQRAAKKELQRLERQIDRFTAREEELTSELAASASDYEKLIGLGAQLRAIQEEKASLEERWLAVAEEVPGFSSCARGDRATLIGHDDQLGLVAGVERHQQAGDVRLGCGRARVELLGDLRVRQNTQVGTRTITAADPPPDDLRDVLGRIHGRSGAH